MFPLKVRNKKKNNNILLIFRWKRTLTNHQQNQGRFRNSLKYYCPHNYFLISRSLNRECIFLNFFDGHDIWHFLGGVGIFFAFMFILTIDDDVRFKRRDMLSIF